MNLHENHSEQISDESDEDNEKEGHLFFG